MILYDQSPLANLVEQDILSIVRLNAKSATDEFASEIMAAHPALFRDIDESVTRKAATALAQVELRLIKEIPSIVDTITGLMTRSSTDPAVRCALAGSLAYLVQPRDLLPDDLPGGYGYVDDCMVLRSTTSELLKFFPEGFSDLETEKRVIDILGLCVPPERLSEFQRAIEEMWKTYHALLWWPGDDVEELTGSIIADPLGRKFPIESEADYPLPGSPRLSLDPGAQRLTWENDLLEISFAAHGTLTIDPATGACTWK